MKIITKLIKLLVAFVSFNVTLYFKDVLNIYGFSMSSIDVNVSGEKKKILENSFEIINSFPTHSS